MSCRRLLPFAVSGEDALACFALHLDPQPALVAAARAFVVEHAPPMPPDNLDALVLLTSELVTNGILHAGTPLEVGLTVLPSSVVVTVQDLNLRRTEQLPYAGREGGWGLGLVAALALRSSLDVHPEGGKTAWFELATGALPHIGDETASRRADHTTDSHMTDSEHA